MNTTSQHMILHTMALVDAPMTIKSIYDAVIKNYPEVFIDKSDLKKYIKSLVYLNRVTMHKCSVCNKNTHFYYSYTGKSHNEIRLIKQSIDQYNQLKLFSVNQINSNDMDWD